MVNSAYIFCMTLLGVLAACIFILHLIGCYMLTMDYYNRGICCYCCQYNSKPQEEYTEISEDEIYDL
jgi:hypothetical protein